MGRSALWYMNATGARFFQHSHLSSTKYTDVCFDWAAVFVQRKFNIYVKLPYLNCTSHSCAPHVFMECCDDLGFSNYKHNQLKNWGKEVKDRKTHSRKMVRGSLKLAFKDTADRSMHRCTIKSSGEEWF